MTHFCIREMVGSLRSNKLASPHTCRKDQQSLTAVLGDILRGSKLLWKHKTHKTLPVHAFAVNYFVVRYPTGYACNLFPYSFDPELFRNCAGGHSLRYGVLQNGIITEEQPLAPSKGQSDDEDSYNSDENSAENPVLRCDYTIHGEYCPPRSGYQRNNETFLDRNCK